MSDAPVNLTSGLPETVLAEEPADAQAALAEAVGQPARQRQAAVSAVVARWPGYLDAWAQLGRCARDDVEAYAAFRVGYHRGLDRLRQSGWRGSGYVRWTHPTNRGFLRALYGLGELSARLGDLAEQRRCAEFLAQLDPSWPPADLAD